MIVLGQRSSGTVIECLGIQQASDWNAWELGVLVYDTAKGQTMENPDGEASRFLGAGDLVVSIRGAVDELARWALPADSLIAFLNRLDAMMQIARDSIERSLGGQPRG